MKATGWILLGALGLVGYYVYTKIQASQAANAAPSSGLLGDFESLIGGGTGAGVGTSLLDDVGLGDVASDLGLNSNGDTYDTGENDNSAAGGETNLNTDLEGFSSGSEDSQPVESDLLSGQTDATANLITGQNINSGSDITDPLSGTDFGSL